MQSFERPTISQVSGNAGSQGRALRPLSIALLTAGRMGVRTPQGGSATLRPGSLVVVRGDEDVAIRARQPDGAWELLLLECPPAWVEAARCLAQDPASESSATDGAQTVVLDERDPEGESLAQAMRHAWLRTELNAMPAHPLQWAAAVLQIAGAALASRGQALDREAVAASTPIATRGTHSVLTTLLELLATRDGIPPSLSLLAQALELSERQTSRLFRRQMGTSFRDYSTRLRLERAMKLLSTTRRPVTEIALSSGWNSLSQFNSAFRRWTGLTPGAYRTQCQA